MKARTPPVVTSVRLDKWLSVARLFKTRSRATAACLLGRVRVNSRQAKAHRALAVGDRIEVSMGGGWTRVLVVIQLRDKPVPRALARELYDDLSPPPPARDPRRDILKQVAVREAGAGRPTKRDRRRIQRFKGE